MKTNRINLKPDKQGKPYDNQDKLDHVQNRPDDRQDALDQKPGTHDKKQNQQDGKHTGYSW